MRVELAQKCMTLEQADLLEAYLQGFRLVKQVTVHERTCCAIIKYEGQRAEILRLLSRFSYDMPKLRNLEPQSGRLLNREYQEKLMGMVTFKAVRTLFFPAPLRAVYTLWKSVPYLLRGVKSLLRGKLHVEVLDGLSIGISIV
jgi:hypothetical protein